MKESIEELIEHLELELNDFKTVEALFDELENEDLHGTVTDELCLDVEECRIQGIIENLDLRGEAMPILKEIWSEHHACNA